jgi:hypothetical protein
MYGDSFRLKKLGLSFNHGSPKKWTNRMWEIMKTSTGNPIWNKPSNSLLNDEIPCFPMKSERHYAGRGVVRPDGTYEPTFHDLLDGNASKNIPSVFADDPPLSMANAAHIRLAIKRVHDRMQQLYGEIDDVDYGAMGDVVDDFLRTKGIP